MTSSAVSVCEDCVDRRGGKRPEEDGDDEGDWRFENKMARSCCLARSAERLAES